MKKHFYSHIVRIDSIHESLNDLDLTIEERQELIVIVESHVHHVVTDTVLSHLSSEDKKEALAHMAKEKHDELWTLLKKKIEKVEDKIHKAVEDLKKELHEDIKEAKQKKD